MTERTLLRIANIGGTARVDVYIPRRFADPGGPGPHVCNVATGEVVYSLHRLRELGYDCAVHFEDCDIITCTLYATDAHEPSYAVTPIGYAASNLPASALPN